MENFIFCAVNVDCKEGAIMKVNTTIQGIIPLVKRVSKNKLY